MDDRFFIVCYFGVFDPHLQPHGSHVSSRQIPLSLLLFLVTYALSFRMICQFGHMLYSLLGGLFGPFRIVWSFIERTSTHSIVFPLLYPTSLGGLELSGDLGSFSFGDHLLSISHFIPSCSWSCHPLLEAASYRFSQV